MTYAAKCLAVAGLLLVGCVPGSGRERDVNYADGEEHRIGNVVLKIDPRLKFDKGWWTTKATLTNASEGQVLSMIRTWNAADEHGNAVSLLNRWSVGGGDDKTTSGQTVVETMSVKPISDATSYRFTMKINCDKTPDGKDVIKEIVFTVPVDPSEEVLSDATP